MVTLIFPRFYRSCKIFISISVIVLVLKPILKTLTHIAYEKNLFIFCYWNNSK